MLKRSAAKRRHLFAATLFLTSAIPIFAALVLALTWFQTPGLNTFLGQVKTVLNVTGTDDEPTVTSQKFRVSPNEVLAQSPADPARGPIAAITPLKDIPLILPAGETHIEPESGQNSGLLFNEKTRNLLLGLWLSGVLFVVAQLAVGAWKAHQHLKKCQPSRPPFVANLLKRAGKTVGLEQLPTIWTSPDAISPSVVGPFRPRIVLPDGAIKELTRQEIHTILLHELAHIKRRDLQLNLALQLGLAIQWFNPFAHMVFRQVRISQEELCDHEAIQAKDKFAYARLLLKVNQMFSIKLSQCSMAVTSNKAILGRRVDQLLSDDCNRELTTSWFWRLTTTSLTFLTCFSLAMVTAATQDIATTPDDSSTVLISPIGTDTISSDEDDLEKKAYLLLTRWHVDGNIDKLGWQHIPYLMRFIEDPAPIERVPVNMLSSQSQDECTVGTTAMWFIDMLCCNKQFPGLNPTLHSRESDEPNKDAIESFRKWWKLVKDWPSSEAQRVSPLMFSNVNWYGGRISFPYHHSPLHALTNYLHSQRVVSVSPNGEFVFITSSKDEQTSGTMSKLTPTGLIEQWKMDDFDSATAFALDTGLLLKTTDFHNIQSTQRNPDLEFIQEGKVIKTVDLASLANSNLKLVAYDLDLEIKDEQLWINTKFSVALITRQKAFSFDQQTGELLKVVAITSSPSPDKTEAIENKRNLHSDELIQELVNFDIAQTNANKTLLEIPFLDVVPAGESKSRADVFDSLGLKENLTTRFRHDAKGHVNFLTWQISPSYDISLMAGNRSPENRDLELTDPKLKVYGVRILLTQED
ncbi:M56 family metallopeptidase [bacterium]|nr:M56 family metallopeptidase [bacterium]